MFLRKAGAQSSQISDSNVVPIKRK
jgi:hypothetical protein